MIIQEEFSSLHFNDTTETNSISFEKTLHILTKLGMVDIRTNIVNIQHRQAKELDYLWLLIQDDIDEEFANIEKLEMIC